MGGHGSVWRDGPNNNDAVNVSLPAYSYCRINADPGSRSRPSSLSLFHLCLLSLISSSLLSSRLLSSPLPAPNPLYIIPHPEGIQPSCRPPRSPFPSSTSSRLVPLLVSLRYACLAHLSRLHGSNMLGSLDSCHVRRFPGLPMCDPLATVRLN